MKKTALILAFLVCFISLGCQGFPKGMSDNSAIEGDIKKINEELGKIKEEIKKIGNPNPEPKNPDTKQGTTNRIPVTPKIVQFLLQNDSDGLKFYLSKPFTLKIYEQNETAEIEIINNMVILNPAKPANEKEIIFSVDSEGILADIPGPDKGGEIQIRFNEQGKILRFRRNAQQNTYELFDVKVIDNRNYKVNIPEPIQLEVSGQNKRKTEVQAAPVDFVYNNNAQFVQQNINISGYSSNYSYNSSAISSKKIKAPGSLKPAGVIAYVKTKNPAMKPIDEQIINEYFQEAAFEGVNVDIAIAQMLHWTNYMKNRERVEKTCNYAGLSNIGDFKGDFKGNSSKGIRAHIQHLKAYAKEDTRRKPIDDPRYKFAYDKGFPGINFEQVCSSWSQNPHYGQTIENILSELYRFSGAL